MAERKSRVNSLAIFQPSFLPLMVKVSEWQSWISKCQKTLAEASRLLSDDDLDTLISANHAEEGSFLSGRQIAAQRSFDLAINQAQYS
jgi:hypothetical protein